MKIIAVGMNYRPHLPELQASVPNEPVLFLKPDSALATDRQPFFLPDFSEEIHYEAEVVVKINRLGKNIAEKFAHRYYNELSIGLDMTARDLQRKARAEGMPWEISKAFDQSAIVGEFRSIDHFDIHNLSFSLSKNGQIVQQGNTSEMIFSIDQVIAYASRFFTLKTGDLIFTGTPAGVGRVQIGDVLEGRLADEKLLSIHIK